MFSCSYPIASIAIVAGNALFAALIAGQEDVKLLETEVDHRGSATFKFANVGDGVSCGNGVEETLGSKNTNVGWQFHQTKVDD